MKGFNYFFKVPPLFELSQQKHEKHLTGPKTIPRIEKGRQLFWIKLVLGQCRGILQISTSKRIGWGIYVKSI